MSEQRYAQLMRRMEPITYAGAAFIGLLSMAACWGRWSAVAALCALQVVLIGSNAWITQAVLPRRGAAFAEALRSVSNNVPSVLVFHYVGWPVPCWLWLPFVALTVDHIKPRTAVALLVAICVTDGAGGLLDGVPWIYPVTFSALATFCWLMMRNRFAIIRDMLLSSDAQRGALEQAHASLTEANQRLRAEIEARARAESELRQAHKLEAVGRLASGVAHEINTPVQFVGDSVAFLGESTVELLALVEAYRAARRRVLAGEAPGRAFAEAQRREQNADTAYLCEHLPGAVESAREGVARIARIVRSMKEFAHPEAAAMGPVDLNRAIRTTLTIAQHEYRYVADVETDLAELPPVVCDVGGVNQVLLNLLVNAAHAIRDHQASGARGRISVRTRREDDAAVVDIGDTGGGIPLEVQPRIFDPFFTTKGVGEGTGQGLAIARAVIDKHGGTIRFESSPGRGTTFTVRLPLAPPTARAGVAA